MIGKLILAVCAHQTLSLVSRFGEARTKYALAQEAADGRGKPLLVVGGPNGSNDTYKDSWVAPFSAIKAWANIQPHGGGDLCVDLDPNACEGFNYLKADITDLPFEDKEFGAVLSSHVLEHMADAETCQRAFSELHRVADAVYLSLPPKSSIFAWLVPDHYLWVKEVGLDTLEVEERGTGNRYLVDPYGPPQLY